MAYIGRDIEYGSLSKQSFVADSSTTSFSLNYDVASAMSLLVSVGGIVQEPDVGYTAAGRTITFTSAPISGDTIFIVFLGKELLVSNTTPQDAIAYQMMIGDGSSSTLALNYSVTNPEDLLVTYNGINQKPGTDYTVSGTTLTFTTTPTTGMKVLVYFMALAGNTLWSGQVTNPKIVSMDASKLTGTMPSEVQDGSFTAQYQDLSTLALHWASVDNKVAMNLTDDFIDHFQDDSGWMAYNGVDAVANSCLFDSSQNHRMTRSGFQPTSPYTISFWIKRGDIGRAQMVYRIGGGDYLYFLANNTVQVERRTGSVTSTATFTSTTDWVHFVVKSVTSQCTVYADNVLIGTNLSAANPSSADTFYIGGASSGGNIQGHLAEFHYVQGLALDATSFGETRGGLWKPKSYTGSHGSTGFYLDFETANSLGQDKSGNGNDCSLSNLDSSDQTTVSPEPNAVANTGSENVYRASGEYVGSGSQATDSNTVLLIHSDTTNGSTTFADSSGSGHTITATGDAQHSTAQNKIGGSSIKFDGTGDYLTIPDHADFDYTGDFTIELWFWCDNTADAGLITHHQSGVANVGLFLNSSSAGTIKWQCGVSPSWSANYGSGLNDGAWHHVAWVRSGTAANNNTLYIDGTSVGTQSNTNTSLAVAADIGIGYYINANSDFMNGYIDEVRISHSARYTANFTPSTTAFTNLVPTTTATGSLLSTTSTADSTVSKASGVMLYKDSAGTNTIGTDLKAYFSADNGSNWTEAASYGSPTTFDGTTKVIPLGETTMSNTGTAVKMKAEWANQVASSGTEKTITAVGDTQHSTAQNKIGTSSIHFDGTGDYLQLANHADWNFGSNNFTMEGWFYMNAVGTDSTLLSNWTSGSPPYVGGFHFYITSANKLSFYWDYGADLRRLTASTNITTNGWHHAAVVRNGSNWNLYLDGVSEASYSGADTIDVASQDLRIGEASNFSNLLNGYMDEIRISDTARYTANFTPSTTAFTTDANTKLLIHSDTTNTSTVFTDSSAVTGKVAQLHGWAVNY